MNNSKLFPKDLILQKFPDADLTIWYGKYWIEINSWGRLGGCDLISDAWEEAYQCLTSHGEFSLNINF